MPLAGLIRSVRLRRLMLGSLVPVLIATLFQSGGERVGARRLWTGDRGLAFNGQGQQHDITCLS